MATYKQIISDLKAKKYKPIYFLCGDEPYYIDQISNYVLKHVLTEAEKGFNELVLYGKENTVESVLENAKRFPMMSEYQVVVVKEAQQIKKIETLSSYALNPLKSTILVINYKNKKIDKRTKEGKTLVAALEKNGLFFESKKLYDNQVPEFIQSVIQEKKFRISPKATAMLVEFLGTDLGRIYKEIDKLCILKQIGQEITEEDVEKNIGISKEFNNFELQSAIALKNNKKIFRILDQFSKNPTSFPAVYCIGTIFNLFSKLMVLHFQLNKSDKSAIANAIGVSPFFLGEYLQASKLYSAPKVAGAISLLREYDMKIKGVNNATNNESELLREMVLRIINL